MVLIDSCIFNFIQNKILYQNKMETLIDIYNGILKYNQKEITVIIADYSRG